MMGMKMTRLIFGISGASGMPLARSVLENFAAISNLEIHLIISRAASQAMAAEKVGAPAELEKYAAMVHDADDFSAAPASGSWRSGGMVICPCAMSSLAAIATGCGTNLIHRAADVCLKERLPLVLVARETPLNLIHLRNMAAATEAGAIIMPFAPAFYAGGGMEEAMRQFAGRVLDQLGVANTLATRWREN